MNTISTRSNTAIAGTAAAIAIAFGTAACGTETAKDSGTPAAPGAIGNVAPFHGSANQIEHADTPSHDNGQQGYPVPDPRIPD
jgi:hypothetical protein